MACTPYRPAKLSGSESLVYPAVLRDFFFKAVFRFQHKVVKFVGDLASSISLSDSKRSDEVRQSVFLASSSLFSFATSISPCRVICRSDRPGSYTTPKSIRSSQSPNFGSVHYLNFREVAPPIRVKSTPYARCGKS